MASPGRGGGRCAHEADIYSVFCAALTPLLHPQASPAHHSQHQLLMLVKTR